MTDPTTQASASPSASGDQVASAPAATAGGQKNPLDLLENILKESKAGGATDALGPTAAVDTAADAAQVAAQQAAQKEAEIAALEAQHTQQDQQALQAEMAQLSEIKNTPAYQARVQQDQAQSQSSAQHADEQKGFEIKQLGHTKV